MNHGQRKARCHGGIDSIASLFERFDSSVRRQMMDADDHRVLCADRSFIACRKRGVYGLLRR
jgi:hypothetical protein